MQQLGGYMVLEDIEQFPNGTPSEDWIYQQKTTCTVNVSTDTFTSAINHDMVKDEGVVFYSTGTLPAPLVPGRAYYVVASGLTLTTFQISTTSGGSALVITSAGTGTHTMWTRPFNESRNFTAVAASNILTASSRHYLYSVTYLGVTYSDRVRFSSTGTLPTPLQPNVDYFVIVSPGDTTFQVSTTSGLGTPVTMTNVGSGTHTVSFIRWGSDMFGSMLGAYLVDSCFMIGDVVSVTGGASGGEEGAVIVEIPRASIQVHDPETRALLERARAIVRSWENFSIVGSGVSGGDGSFMIE